MNKTLGICAMLSILGIGCIIGGMSGLHFDVKRLCGNGEVKEYHEAFSTQEIRNLKMKIPYGSLSILSGEVEKIEIHMESDRNEQWAFLVDEDDTLNIKSLQDENYFDHWWDMFYNWNPEVTISITVPSTYIFDSMEISLSAGNIEMNHLNLRRLDANVSAGKLTMDNLNCEDLKTRNSAGSTWISNSEIKKINSEVSAGELKMRNVAFETLDFDISAGHIDAEVRGKKEDYNVNINVSAGNSNLSSQTGTTQKHIYGSVNAGSAKFIFVE